MTALTNESPILSIQWHLTNRCGKRCKHCYIEDATIKSNPELNLNQLIFIYESIMSFSNKRGVGIQFVFTGGDPLMSADLLPLIERISEDKQKFILLGNPETLNEKIILQLKDLGLSEFQISLDGLEKTHDWVRGKGSYQRSWEAVQLLNKHGIVTKVMFTLYPFNSDELIPLMQEAADKSVRHFSFDIGVSIGNGLDLPNFKNTESVREIFHAYLEQKEALQKKGYRTLFKDKANLLVLASYERNEFPSGTFTHTCHSGCHVGWTSVCVLSDGSLEACRRMPFNLGYINESQSFEDIWLNNRFLRAFRRKKEWKDCGGCHLYTWCRGCPGLTYSQESSPFLNNPYCWRSKDQQELPISGPLTDLEGSAEEEWDYIVMNHINYSPQKRIAMKDMSFKRAFVDFTINRAKRLSFLKEPQQFKGRLNLSEDAVSLLYINMLRKEQFGSDSF